MGATFERRDPVTGALVFNAAPDFETPADADGDNAYDVVVQVKGDDTRAQIDVRSVSRYGMHDLGANAARIRALFEEITTTLEKGEKTVLEQAKPKEEAAPAKKDATQKRVKKRVKKRRPVTR